MALLRSGQTMQAVELNDRGPRVNDRRGEGGTDWWEQTSTHRHKATQRNCVTRFNFIEKSKHETTFPEGAPDTNSMTSADVNFSVRSINFHYNITVPPLPIGPHFRNLYRIIQIRTTLQVDKNVALTSHRHYILHCHLLTLLLHIDIQLYHSHSP